MTPRWDQRPMGLEKFFQNALYSVQLHRKPSEWGEIILLMVRRNDEAPVRSWSDMQRIKNEIVGTERVAVEVYPAESDLVDQANMYHLWVLPEGFKLPFGLHMTTAMQVANALVGMMPASCKVLGLGGEHSVTGA